MAPSNRSSKLGLALSGRSRSKGFYAPPSLESEYSEDQQERFNISQYDSEERTKLYSEEQQELRHALRNGAGAESEGICALCGQHKPLTSEINFVALSGASSKLQLQSKQRSGSERHRSSSSRKSSSRKQKHERSETSQQEDSSSPYQDKAPKKGGRSETAAKRTAAKRSSSRLLGSGSSQKSERKASSGASKHRSSSSKKSDKASSSSKAASGKKESKASKVESKLSEYIVELNRGVSSERQLELKNRFNKIKDFGDQFGVSSELIRDFKQALKSSSSKKGSDTTKRRSRSRSYLDY